MNQDENIQKEIRILDDKEMLIQTLRDKRIRAQRLSKEIRVLEYQIENFEQIHNYFKPPDSPSKSPGEAEDNSGGSGGKG